MGPTHLPKSHRPEVKDRRTVADEDTLLGAEERSNRVAAPIREDGVDRSHRRRECPQRGQVTRPQPGRRITVLDRGLVNGLLGLRIGRLERLAGAVLHGAQSPERYRNPKQLLQETLRLSATEMVIAGEETHDSDQRGSEWRRRDLVAVIGRPCSGSASKTFDLMSSPLGDVGPMVTEIDPLIAASLGVRRGRERGRASETSRGIEVHDLVDRIRRQDRSVRTPMAPLTTALALRLRAWSPGLWAAA